MRKFSTYLTCLPYFIFSIFMLIALLFVPKNTLRKVYNKLDGQEAEKRLDFIKSHLLGVQSVLDVGAGSGRFGKLLADKCGIKVEGVDVVDYLDSPIPFHVYDGKKLPFPDNSFDTVITLFVLHHCSFQEELFTEMVRVAKKKIIILEDCYETLPQHLFTLWNDYHTNILQGWIKVIKGLAKPDITKMPMPLTQRSVDGWKRFFRSYPVKLLSVDTRHANYKPLMKASFCLEVTKNETSKG